MVSANCEIMSVVSVNGGTMQVVSVNGCQWDSASSVSDQVSVNGVAERECQ